MRLLRRQGYEVLVAADAKEGLRLLTRPLVAQRPGLKVIYMSGYTHKLFNSETLGRKIREVLDR